MFGMVKARIALCGCVFRDLSLSFLLVVKFSIDVFIFALSLNLGLLDKLGVG